MSLSIIFASFAIGSQLAVDTVQVGHPAVQKPKLPIGVETTEVFVTRNGTRQSVSKSTVSISRVRDGYLIVQTNPIRNGLSIDSAVVGATNLAPVRHVEAMPDRQASLSFSGGRVTGSKRDSAGLRDVNLPVDARRFDFSSLAQVTGCLPLEAGYNAVVMLYDVFSQRERSISVSVSGRESVTVSGSQHDAWKIVTDFGTHRVTKWMDAKSRRDLRWEIVIPNGVMEGIVTFSATP